MAARSVHRAAALAVPWFHMLVSGPMIYTTTQRRCSAAADAEKVQKHTTASVCTSSIAHEVAKSGRQAGHVYMICTERAALL